MMSEFTLNAKGDISKGAPAKLPALSAKLRVKRDRLVSRMLADRNVMRLICAPTGMGKTTLVLDYLETARTRGRVVWVDASKPEFLAAVDIGLAETITDDGRETGEDLPILVVDDLPYLNEVRTVAFSNALNWIMDQGWEVIATCAPAFDTYGPLQADRVLISAWEMMFDECERIQAIDLGLMERSWDASSQDAVACLLGDNSDGAKALLHGIVDGGLTNMQVKYIIAALLLGNGTSRDLQRLDISLPRDDAAWLADAYPYIGIAVARGSFEACRLGVHEIVDGLGQDGLKRLALEGEAASEIADIVAKAGDLARACEIAAELVGAQRAFELAADNVAECLDAGDVELLDRVQRAIAKGDATLKPKATAVRACCAFVRGDAKGALTLSSRALLMLEGIASEGDGNALREGASFYLALVTAWALCALHEPDFDLAPSDCDDKLERRARRRRQRMHKVAWKLCAAACDGEAEVQACAAATMLLLKLLSGQSLCGQDIYSALDKAERSIDAGRAGACERFGLHVTLEVTDALADPDRGALEMRTSCTLKELEVLTRNIAALMAKALDATDDAPRKWTALLLKADLDGYLVDTGALQWGNAPVGSGATPPKAAEDMLPAVSLGEEAGDNPEAVRSAPQAASDRAVVPAPQGAIEVAKPVPRLRVCLFGGFSLYVDGELRDASALSRRRSRELLVLLVLKCGRESFRDELISCLWNNAAGRHCADNLYSAWSYLRHALEDITGFEPCPYVVRSGKSYSVDARYIESDVAEFEQLSRRALRGRSIAQDLPYARGGSAAAAAGAGPKGAALGLRDVQPGQQESALDAERERICMFDRIDELYRGPVMGGAKLDRSSRLVAERLRDLMAEDMLAAAQLAASLGMGHRASWYACRAIEVGGMREESYQARMRAQMALGQRTGALDTFFRMQKFLQEQQGLDPSRESSKMYESLLADEGQGIAARALVADGVSGAALRKRGGAFKEA